jgi:4-hydroxythreonine-4-phosphate dehydrogenase
LTNHYPYRSSEYPTEPYKPRLAVTLGDPTGIGPEVILKALADLTIANLSSITVVGSRTLLQQTYQQLQQQSTTVLLANPDDLTILDIPIAPNLEAQIIHGKESAASGSVSFTYLETAISHCLKGQFDGIVTAPISKAAWHAAGHSYPGQTELLAEKSGTQRYGMLFVARSPHTNWTLRTLLATTHIPLQQVPDRLTPDLLTAKLELLLTCLKQDFGVEKPRIAIAGLNPHSGEQGQLGHEEQTWIIPWIQEMQHRWTDIRLDGPIPPDTMWVKPGQAWFGTTVTPQAHDAYLALYHDQGLIPVKLMAFDRAVNTSIGLPFIRTSPDHGTAFDIAGKNLADATSMKAALQLATELGIQRKMAQPHHCLTDLEKPALYR